MIKFYRVVNENMDSSSTKKVIKVPLNRVNVEWNYGADNPTPTIDTDDNLWTRDETGTHCFDCIEVTQPYAVTSVKGGVKYFTLHKEAFKYYEELDRPKAVFKVRPFGIKSINVNAHWFSESGDLSELDKLKIKVQGDLNES